jgi:Domain of unknown function (DUF5010)/DUF5010 C-terminal domain/F5/8 type C domain
MKRLFKVLTLSVCCLFVLSSTISAQQYLGATCGFDYSGQMTGDYGAIDSRNTNHPLYNPTSNLNTTWDDWAAQLGQSGIDFICPNISGCYPNTGAEAIFMTPLLTSLTVRGLASQVKFGLFDDNANSWQASYNRKLGNFSNPYQDPVDMSNPQNWVYLYDYNYKIFFQTIPDANLFKINGRPVIWMWNAGGGYSNSEGNFSRAILYVRQRLKADFGINPFIVVNTGMISNDSTVNRPGVVDAIHQWFNADPFQNNSLTTEEFEGTTAGVAVASFNNPATNPTKYIPADHGITLDSGLTVTGEQGSSITLMEGFSDYEEDAAIYRVRNLDASGNPLTYSQTNYDFPNQRLGIIRKHSRHPFPSTLKFEAEGCDFYAGATGGNGQTNFYRNGNIAIETTSDVGGGFDVGWMQPGESFTWDSVSLNGTPHFQIRIATPSTNCTAHVVIDGVAKPSQTLPSTGGYQTWTTYDFGSYGSFSASYHTIQFVFDNGGENFNWWQIAGGTQLNSSTVVPTDLAYLKPVFASTGDGSGYNSGNQPSNATDGLTTTFWQPPGYGTATSTNQWIYVDLGSVESVNAVTLMWGNYFWYPTTYNVQTSNDASTWTTQYSTTSGTGADAQINFSSTVNCRYVRLNAIQANTAQGEYGINVYEFKVLGTP